MDLDSGRPNVARMYDYYLGGKDNFAADRAAVADVLRAAPEAAVLARANRAFLGRAVRWLAAHGVRQFLDLGTGLPTRENVHQVALEARPDARVVYVDHDPVVLVHARALLGSCERVRIVGADMREPGAILAAPEVAELLDLDEPVGVLFVSVLHFLTDAEDPAGVVGAFMDAVPSGSHLVISHATAEVRPDAARQAAAVYDRASAPMVQRSGEQVEALFRGVRLLPPGVVPVTDWPLPRPSAGGHRWILGGVGRRP
ncbi:MULTISPECIES: SAM-dependent methyltransferase [Actinomadura]|uniref:SAM-dependent methyltransferase n=1 Tax=Actinomadura yumaensis TaxID=111807 RepID=A0ABW2CBY5_9ACTN|nr:SAM-dependent methyltransferase [Actinomadura sp. J1-007]MWK38079.1 SAM-dependent methyltransferase [Actinomadura sp. J1-007]